MIQGYQRKDLHKTTILDPTLEALTECNKCTEAATINLRLEKRPKKASLKR
jgi:hypothetical protein